ncbi:MAG: hypothetical protein AVDCRST_MAG25-556 [uncultured Rubrobacteraceae bacterium]|uniref:Uncharacterized protein n=1 Tax=uncultured Rubrobacteraceae bacterium TaxID=349277 RepID=A0A6J4R3H6_9ACTN|nr:MAG: hypothetical protein AVDCRST_MAG25-556 [uncultured Rubrobacteraceae bacterium]
MATRSEECTTASGAVTTITAWARAENPCARLGTCKGIGGGSRKHDEGPSTKARRDGHTSPGNIGDRAKGRESTTKAQDVHGTRIRLTRDGLAYDGEEEEFVPFSEMAGTRPASPPLWNPASNLFEVAVARRNGPDLIIRNLPLQTAVRLEEAITNALRERQS